MPFGPWNVTRPVFAWIASSSAVMSLKPRTIFGLRRIEIEVELREQPAAAPAAADRQHRLHRLVGEEAVDVRRAVAILPGQIAVPR